GGPRHYRKKESQEETSKKESCKEYKEIGLTHEATLNHLYY
ncbi:MAG: hypothetical protein ACI959_000865, partial [Limisphaerales bacterium]